MNELRVGFVGLGIMGAPMAANLVRAGFPVSVYNRTSSRCEPLVALGAKACTDLSQLALASDVVITIVSDTPDVESLLFGPGGVMESLKAGSVAIDMSTISPKSTVTFARRLSERSIAMLDAPVSGGEGGAKAGALSIMVGGEPDVFARCLPLFQAMGKLVRHMGPSGSGQMTKMVNQIVGSMNLLATVEGLRVASAAGLNLEQVLEVVGGGAAGSWMLANLGPKIAREDFAPGFSIRLHEKDLRLASEFCRELGLDTPGVALITSLMQQALGKHFGELGNQALYRLWT